MFACESSLKKLQTKISFIYILLIWSMALVPLPFLNIVAREVLPCSTEKVKFEDIIYQRHQSLNSRSAGGCSSENRLLNFDILMLLDDNYGGNYLQKAAEELQPRPLAIKYRLRF